MTWFVVITNMSTSRCNGGGTGAATSIVRPALVDVSVVGSQPPSSIIPSYEAASSFHPLGFADTAAVRSIEDCGVVPRLTDSETSWSITAWEPPAIDILSLCQPLGTSDTSVAAFDPVLLLPAACLPVSKRGRDVSPRLSLAEVRDCCGVRRSALDGMSCSMALDGMSCSMACSPPIALPDVTKDGESSRPLRIDGTVVVVCGITTLIGSAVRASLNGSVGRLVVAGCGLAERGRMTRPSISRRALAGAADLGRSPTIVRKSART